MKITNKTKSLQAGFTLPEVVVAAGMATVVGACTIYVFLTGTVLYAKNTAENLSHDQNRIAVNRLVRDIHGSMSVPQLGTIVSGNLKANPTAPVGSWTPYGTNLTFWAEAGTGPTSGVGFKKLGNSYNQKGGPFKVKNDPGNADLIQIESGTDNPPYVGMELVFPYYNMEGTVESFTSGGQNHYNIRIAGGLEKRIKEKNGTNQISFYMSRYAYVVEDGELRFYSSAPPPPGVTWPTVIAHNIIAPPGSTAAKTVNVTSSAFQPSSVTIRLGETLQWNWNADKRSVTSKTPAPPAPTGPFDSGKLDIGATFARTFKNLGTFGYFSDGTGGTSGTVQVVAWPGSNQSVRPFSQATPDYVTINLTTEDDRYSNRKYKAVNTLLAGSVPIRAKISKTQ